MQQVELLIYLYVNLLPLIICLRGYQYHLSMQQGCITPNTYLSYRMLFDDHLRTDSIAVAGGESTFHFLDRSAWLRCAHVRRLLNEWRMGIAGDAGCPNGFRFFAVNDRP